MRKVLGTHLGHSAIYTMCHIMEERYALYCVGDKWLRFSIVVFKYARVCVCVCVCVCVFLWCVSTAFKC